MTPKKIAHVTIADNDEPRWQRLEHVALGICGVCPVDGPRVWSGLGIRMTTGVVKISAPK